MKRIIDMLSRTRDAAMLVDESGTVACWNKAAERLLGFRAQEVIGRPCHAVLCGQTLGCQPLCSPSCAIGRKLAGGGGVRNYDMQTRHKSGRLVWLNISSLPVPSRKKGRFLAVHLFRNITKQIRVHRLMNKLHEALLSATMPTMAESPSGSRLPAARESVPQIPEALPLSVREKEILCLLAAGKNTKGIAEGLSISPATVSNHVQHILEKLGAHSRLEALAIVFHPTIRRPPAR
jgi:PAS domain S-box-containing protein